MASTRTRWIVVAAALAVAGAVLQGCGGDTTEEQRPGLANPASEFCEDQGGRVEIDEDPAGGQVGTCVFPDGSSCEEWAYYNGECEPDATAP